MTFPLGIDIPTPGEDFLEWANNLSNVFLTYTVPVATSPENWREWATNFLLANSSFINFPLPVERLYPNIEDWKKWAEFFCNNIYTQ